MNGPLLRLGALELGTAFLFGILSFYAGIALFKRYMRVPHLWTGIVQQRNLAMALFLASFLAGMLYLMNAGASAVTELAASLFGERGTMPVSFAGFAMRLVMIYVLSAGGSVLLLMASLWLYDKHTPEVHELDSVRAGNVAAAMLLSALCVSVFMLMESPFATLFQAFSPPLRNNVLELREPFLNSHILWMGLAKVMLAMLGIAILCHLGFRFLHAIDTRSDEQAACEDGNLGVACFVALSIVSFALFLRAGLHACENLAARLIQGESPSLRDILQNALLALALITFSILLGILLTRLGFRLFGRLIRHVDPERAIVRGNLPAAVVAGVFVLSLALLMSDGTRILLTSFTTRPVPLGGGFPASMNRTPQAPRP